MIRNIQSVAVLGLLALLSFPAFAPAGVQAQTPEDFLFKTPRATLSLKLGYGIPSAGSDLFQDIDGTYTLQLSDFQAPVVGGELSILLNDRMDLAFELSYSGSSTWSEHATLMWPDSIPIEQQTSLTRVPLTASFKYFLLSRGREVGSFSWIPAKWSPYLGLGGGWTYYRYEQVGDFVDPADGVIFPGEAYSDGWGLCGHLLGGLQLSLSPRWLMTAEARYSLAEADLERPQFSSYDPIDLSGFQGTLGFGIRF